MHVLCISYASMAAFWLLCFDMSIITSTASLPQSSPSSATPLSSSQPLPVSSVGHKTLLMSPNTTTMAHTPPHGYHGPPISAVRSGPFMMDSRWPTQTATTVDVQDPRRGEEESEGVVVCKRRRKGG